MTATEIGRSDDGSFMYVPQNIRNKGGQALKGMIPDVRVRGHKWPLFHFHFYGSRSRQSRSSSNSLQNGDLAGVISRVLHSAVQHEADIVLLAGNSVLEPRLGQSGD